MRILVLGAGGMAGHVVSLYLRERGFQVDTLSASHQVDEDTIRLDVTDKSLFTAFLETHSFDAVVNCIGILIQQSEERQDLSTYLNSFLPHQLEQLYRGSATRIIHLSTDCVFSGQHAPYYENSPYDGELFYDRSKALGEIINDKDLTLRMSIIGPDMQKEGVGLFNWFSRQSGEIFGYTRAMWNGITTIELAKGIDAALKQGLTGLYHLVPAGNISKYELLKLFCRVFERDDIEVGAKDEVVLDKTLINTRTDFDFRVASYPKMIAEMKEWIDGHPELYRHYDRNLAQ